MDSSTECRDVADSVSIHESNTKTSTSRQCTRARTSAQCGMPQSSVMSVEVKKEIAEDSVNFGLVQKRFSPEEDAVLKEGIRKHGLGKWSVMLKDKSLRFHPARTRDSIRVRADTLGLSKQKKKSNKGTGTLTQKKK